DGILSVGDEYHVRVIERDIFFLIGGLEEIGITLLKFHGPENLFRITVPVPRSAVP
ncbi:hypothetical protein HDU67_006058, partial [Dinochytrium kinnereticum]